MNYCGACGARLAPGQVFCGACGAPVAQGAADVPQGTQGVSERQSPPRGGRRMARPRGDAPAFVPMADIPAPLSPPPLRPPRRSRRMAVTVWGILVGFLLLVLVAVGHSNSDSSGASGTGSAQGAASPSGQQGVAPPADTATPAPATPTDVPAPTDVPTQTPSQWAQGASGDTYADVRDHPDLHQNDKVVWRCTINKFLGADPNDSTATDVTCGGFGDALSEAALVVPFSVDTSSMHAGDTVTVYGTVAQPFQGTNGFGAQITEPQVDAVYLADASMTPTVDPTTTPIITPMATDTAPASQAARTDPAPITLATGARCSFVAGATTGVGDLRANYDCTSGQVIYGDIDKRTKPWTVLVWRGPMSVTPTRGQLVTVGVKSVK